MGNSSRIFLSLNKTYIKRCEKTLVSAFSFSLVIIIFCIESITKQICLSILKKTAEEAGSTVAKGAGAPVGTSAANSAIAAGKAALTAAPEVEAGAVAAAPEAGAVAVAASPEIEEGLVIGAVCLA